MSEASADKVARRLKALREWQDIKQRQLAEICQVDRSAVAQWETGKTRIGIEQAERICSALGVTLDYIYLGRFDLLPHSVALALQEAERRI